MSEDTNALTLCQLILQHQEFLKLSGQCIQVYPTLSLSFSSFLCLCVSLRAVKCDIVWDCKQPNRLFISVTPLRLAHQRLFTPVNVCSTSENMMSSYYHSYTEASDGTFQPFSISPKTMGLLNVLPVSIV